MSAGETEREGESEGEGEEEEEEEGESEESPKDESEREPEELPEEGEEPVEPGPVSVLHVQTGPCAQHRGQVHKHLGLFSVSRTTLEDGSGWGREGGWS